MKLLHLLMAAAASATLARADIADRWIERAREAQAAFDTQAALKDYLKADQARPDDPAILQGIAREYSDLTLDTTDRSAQLKSTEAALSYAKRALALAPDNSVIVLSVAICYGKLARYSDLGAKVADAKLVKAYTERALELDPNYDYAHHLLGEWNTEIAELSRAQRWVIQMVYGSLPNASAEAGVKEMKKAISLAPGCPSHWEGLGMAYLADQQTAQARLAFECALSLPARERIDSEAQREAKAALLKLN